MAAATYNMSIEQGSDYEVLLTINDSQNSPIDLTGHVFKGEIRKSVTDTTLLASFSFEVLDQSILANKGKVKVKLTSAASSSIVIPSQKTADRSSVELAYDVESSLGGVVKRWLVGKVTMIPEVTK